MDYYIVRVYRRNECEEQNMTGLVETVGHDRVSVFNNREELWHILSGKAAQNSRTRANERKSAKIGRDDKPTTQRKGVKT